MPPGVASCASVVSAAYARVTMTVTIPEKTLEHWVSQYISARYSTKVSLWWPTFGEDIATDPFPYRPGKAFRIEVKTSTNSGSRGQHHDVKIDTEQLWSYLQKPPAEHPFYIFPAPFWPGLLVDHATSTNANISSIAFQRGRLRHSWFAEWMMVLTAQQVATTVGVTATAPSPARHTVRRLVRFVTDPASGLPRWAEWGAPGSGVSVPADIPNLYQFLSELDTCGRPGWPQILRLPLDDPILRRSDFITPEQARAVLIESSRTMTQFDVFEPRINEVRFAIDRGETSDTGLSGAYRRTDEPPRETGLELVSYLPARRGGEWGFVRGQSDTLYSALDSDGGDAGGPVWYIDGQRIHR